MYTSATKSPPNYGIEAFYDGACPICVREVRFLRRLDKKKRIQFTDIASPDFQASDYGKTMEAFMSGIHGRLPDGTSVRGVKVFRRLYAAVGLGPLVWITRLPFVSGLLDWGYRVFARNRLRWTRRCSTEGGTCGIAARRDGANVVNETTDSPVNAA
jgi:predicted DCC family thiol-disulfide oxidoreductase YuxK